MQVALIGVTGYSGMTLYQMLLSHPAIKAVTLYGHNLTTPTPLATLVPPLGFLTPDAMVQPYSATRIMATTEAVFFATSAGVTRQLAAPYLAAQFPVIDLSGDFRLKDPAAYTAWYHQPAAPAEALASAYYGLAEFGSAAGHAYVANPGCYATATLLALAPLVQQHLIDPARIIVHAMSGTSGAGKSLSTATHFSVTDENLQLYKLNQHQHLPEMLQQLQAWDPTIKALQFSTTLLPVTRGLMSTCYLTCTPAQAAQVDQAFTTTYANQPWVQYLGETMPTLKTVVGANYCAIGAVYNPATQCLMVVSVIDNLIKGAGGQALQNFNQFFGFAPTAGLPTTVTLP
ncbi:N-acetyl-gamma-glutamyl-phosphate reductase [Lacticaseibacillus daqingensis]|uniref:N-acetyl-gamma-glutamyl-phosphate reductase n=1 Tax=Lacticaseibacillus daqingensis TaxID=2486014 RepID=UPI000F76AF0D|nr:N-acetyl-gamma-glutamyl-phosphate reductase [Lacticaseibacillus daqingensis]